MLGHSRYEAYGQGGHGWEHPTRDGLHPHGGGVATIGDTFSIHMVSRHEVVGSIAGTLSIGMVTLLKIGLVPLISTTNDSYKALVAEKIITMARHIVATMVVFKVKDSTNMAGGGGPRGHGSRGGHVMRPEHNLDVFTSTPF
ncbi:hypothetical protein RHSIM_Rhsim09G0060700 [Rhododendron simsii]|uniref:Uncharacterized protein n=1 Tax=Rhododendron simsii TaxID=118357 RepID=A0A834LH17_RHOSS|nr:hypothetical protein RHSIM_Rhsim09G0060700 [Rhododendron simsii]